MDAIVKFHFFLNFWVYFWKSNFQNLSKPTNLLSFHVEFFFRVAFFRTLQKKFKTPSFGVDFGEYLLNREQRKDFYSKIEQLRLRGHLYAQQTVWIKYYRSILYMLILTLSTRKK